jgi:protease I
MAVERPRTVIITGPGFQDEEFVYPYYRLLEAECSVDVATKDGAVVHGKYGVPARATMRTADLSGRDFDLVVLPGGCDRDVLEFVRRMDAAGRLIAAICHGPWILISAGILRGRRITAYQSIADDVRNAGAEYVEAAVVVDGNLVTSPHYRDNGIFMRTALEGLNLRTDG